MPTSTLPLQPPLSLPSCQEEEGHDSPSGEGQGSYESSWGTFPSGFGSGHLDLHMPYRAGTLGILPYEGVNPFPRAS